MKMNPSYKSASFHGTLFLNNSFDQSKNSGRVIILHSPGSLSFSTSRTDASSPRMGSYRTRTIPLSSCGICLVFPGSDLICGSIISLKYPSGEKHEYMGLSSSCCIADFTFSRAQSGFFSISTLFENAKDFG